VIDTHRYPLSCQHTFRIFYLHLGFSLFLIQNRTRRLICVCVMHASNGRVCTASEMMDGEDVRSLFCGQVSVLG
jgi:hypothetical protein